MRRHVNTERVHVILRKGDSEKLKTLFPVAGPSTIIRMIVSNFVDHLESSENAEIKTRLIQEISKDERVEQLIADLAAESSQG